MVSLQAYHEEDAIACGKQNNDTPSKQVNDNPVLPKTRSPFAETCDELFAAGYTAIPIEPAQKVPGQWTGKHWTPMSGWNDYSHRRPAPAMVDRWRTWPDAGVGITLGTIVGELQLVAVDLDTDDQDEIEKLRSQLPLPTMIKRGARGLTAFYLSPKTTRTKRYMIGEKPDQRCVLEILTGNAPRLTVMPPSIHPHGMVYRYLTGNEVVPIAQLSVLTNDHFEQLEDTLEGMGWKGSVAPPTRQPDDDGERNMWRIANDTALQNLSTWVPMLGLPKTKGHSNGRYEAIARWRNSGTGQAISLRKPNLSFHHDGIKDMGTDDKFTPIDVVMEAFACDLDCAVGWLNDQLGLTLPDALPTVMPLPPRELIQAADGTLSDAETGEIVAPPPANENRLGQDDEFPDSLTYPAGLLGIVVDWIVATARNPNRVLALGAALVVLGTLAGRRDAGPTNAGTSLFVLMLAASGSGKQHGLNQIHRLMKAAKATAHIGAGEFGSVQALNNQLKRQPLAVCVQDEYGSFLSRINAKNAGGHEKAIAKVQRSIWGVNYGVTQTTDFSGTPGETIAAPAISIYGVSTPGEFYKSLGGADIENGTLNRYLLLSTLREIEDVDPETSDAIVPPEIADALSDLYRVRERPPLVPFETSREQQFPDQSDEVEPSVIKWENDAAKAVYFDMKATVKRLKNEDRELAPFLARTVEIALRIATICAVGRKLDGPSISAADMEWGREIAIWSARKMTTEAGDFVSDNATGEIWGKVKNKLRRSGGTASYRDVARSLTLNAKTMIEVITGMVGAGLIEPFVTPAVRGGRETKHLRLLV